MKTRLEKIHVIVDMSSVTGGLRRNFSAASGVTPCAEISAHGHDGEKISAQEDDTEIVQNETLLTTH